MKMKMKKKTYIYSMPRTTQIQMWYEYFLGKKTEKTNKWQPVANNGNKQ